MANQISVNSGTGNITVTTSRAVIGTVANVLSADTAGSVYNNAQPNITSVGTLNSLAVAGDITTVDSITLDTTATEAYAAAKIWWNNIDGTFNMGMFNNVTQQVGQELFFYGKAVGNIVDGQSVMFAGVQGDHILMRAADASLPGFRKEYIIGIATQNITNGNFGYVTWFGKINNVDTRGFPTGSLVWFDPTTIGGLTNVEPTGNSIKVLMAAVIKAETSPAANNGILLVRPTFGPNLNDIESVQVASPLNGQVLTYNAATNTWINANVSANVSNVAYAANAGNAIFANTAAIANVSNIAYSVNGANVTGTVANATYAVNADNATIAASANNVTLANVSGAGNIASINLDGSASNILYGNGTFAPAAAVTNANYANFAGNAFSVDGANVVGAVANATYADTANFANDSNIANRSNIAYSVDAGNVNGTVANAAYADNAGNAAFATNAGTANIANIAYSIDGANVSGAVANATYAANAGYSDNAGNASVAYSVDGANVSGIVANAAYADNAGNATFSTDAGNANIANIAYSVDGANVSGEVANATYANTAGKANSVDGVDVVGAVANATYADDAAYAGTANIAYSVDAANVAGLGNIATINLDGNASNLLDGTGNWVAIPTPGDSNYANFAGEVVNATQSNITQTGNLVSLTINNGITDSTTVETDPALIALGSQSYVSKTTAYDPSYNLVGQTSNAHILYGPADGYDFNFNGYFNDDYYVNDGTGTARGTRIYTGTFDAAIGNASTDPLVPSSFVIKVPHADSNLANVDTQTVTTFGIGNGAAGFNLVIGAPYNAPAFNFFVYGDGANGQQGLRFRRRNGNADARQGVIAGDYLGNIEWQGAAFSSGGGFFGSAKIAPKVDSSYPGPDITDDVPIGIEVKTVDANSNVYTHTFYANGNVSFNDAISANVVNANSVSGTLTTAAQPNITSVGNLTSLTVNNTISGNTFRFSPTGTAIGNTTYVQVQNAVGDSKDALVLNVGSGTGSYNREFLATNGTNTVPYAYFETFTDDSIGAGNVAVPGGIGLTVFTSSSNLTSGDPGLRTSLSIGSALNFTAGAPTTGNVASIQTFNYGLASNPAASTALRLTRRRGNASARLSLEPNDYLGNIEWRGAVSGGGTPGGQRFAKIAPRVDSSYVANTTAQPVGIEFWVTDNTTARSHTFYANGNVQFNNAVVANSFSGNGAGLTNVAASQITNGTSVVSFTGPSGDLVISTNNVSNGVYTSGRVVSINGIGNQPPANGVYSLLNVINGSMNISQDNIGGGLPTFDFKMYENTTSYLNPYTFFRARGTQSSPQAIANNDSVMTQSYWCYSGPSNTYVGVGSFDAGVKTNDGAGNVSSKITISTTNDNDGSEISLVSDDISLNGNVQITGTNRFMQLSVYTATALNAITGQLGQIATVSDSTPNGMMAYWDGTNSRWSYVHDNSAV